MASKSVVRPPRVFISHTSADHDFVEWLADRLESDGCDVWTDDVKLKIGDSIPEEVQKAIGSADYLIAVLSPTSVNRKWVKEELNTALAKGVTKGKSFVLPCILRRCRLPEFLTHRIYADFENRPPEEAYAALLRTIFPSGLPSVDVEKQTAALSSGRATRRREAAVSLGRSGSVLAVATLMSRLPDEADPSVLEAVIEALGRLHAREAVRPLSRLLASDEPVGVRLAAAIALGRIGERRNAAAALSRATADPEFTVRWAALWALVQVRGTTAVRTIERLRADRDPHMRLLSERAMTDLRLYAYLKRNASVAAAAPPNPGSVSGSLSEWRKAEKELREAAPARTRTKLK
jgi:hypothetical protein